MWGSRCTFKSAVSCGGRLAETRTLKASEEASPMSKRGLHAKEQPMETVFGMSSELQGG